MQHRYDANASDILSIVIDLTPSRMIRFVVFVSALVISFFGATQFALAQQAKPAISNIKTASALEQGDVMVVRVKADDVITLEAQFSDVLVNLVPDDVANKKGPGNYIGLIGIDALLEPGQYTLTLTATNTTGAIDVGEKSILIKSGRYITEKVKIATKLSNLIDPDLNAKEAAEVRAVYNGQTPEQWWTAPFRQPARGRLASQYGPHRIYNGVDLGSYHAGMDFSAVAGTPVFAAAPGRVVMVKQLDIRGNMIIVDHGRGVFTGYCHLSKTLVKVGQMVDVGEKIGEVGTTGRSQGNHLHFELAVGGITVEPSYWMKVMLP